MLDPNNRPRHPGRALGRQEHEERQRLTCHVLPALRQAADELDAGEVADAGCTVREAATRLLVALCELHDCLPRHVRAQQAPSELLRKLRRSKCGDKLLRRMEHVQRVANCLAHSRPICPADVEAAMQRTHRLAYLLRDVIALPMSEDQSPAPKRRKGRKRYLPTEEEIRSECEAIRQGWSKSEKYRRAYGEGVRLRTVYPDPTPYGAA